MSGWSISIRFFPFTFWILQEPEGLLRHPDEKLSGQKCGSLNEVRVLRPGEHVSPFRRFAVPAVGFSALGTRHSRVMFDVVLCVCVCI